MEKRIRYPPEQIITKLREAEIDLSQGKTIGQACRTLEISDQTYDRWRREYGGMDVTQARNLKEKENTHEGDGTLQITEEVMDRPSESTGIHNYEVEG